MLTLDLLRLTECATCGTLTAHTPDDASHRLCTCVGGAGMPCGGVLVDVGMWRRVRAPKSMETPQDRIVHFRSHVDMKPDAIRPLSACCVVSRRLVYMYVSSNRADVTCEKCKQTEHFKRYR